MTFHLEIKKEPYLAPNGRQVHALLTIASTGLDAQETGAGSRQAAVVIIVDCSGSMGSPPTKFAAAIRATIAAVDSLRDGSRFAVIRGTDRALVRYPDGPGMALAGPETRAAARRAVEGITPGGGTNLSRWLEQARELLDEHPSAVRHAILLTDGWNEPSDRLEQVLATCARSFTCDLRGIGDGWNPQDLQRIASVLHGTADAAPADADLVAQVRDMVRTAMRKVVPDLRIRIHTAAFARVHFLKQVQPTELDLAERAKTIGDRTLEYSVGSWGNESRVYHLCLEVAPDRATAEEDLRAARVDLLAGTGRLAGPGLVLAHWTDQLEPVSELSIVISENQKRADLRGAIIAGCEAYQAGDRQAAEAAFGRAVRLAHELADQDALDQLRSVVDIIDSATGEVRMRPGISRRDVKILEIRSPRTAISFTPDELSRLDRPPVAGPYRRCECGWLSPPDAVFCQKCRRRFDDQRSDGT